MKQQDDQTNLESRLKLPCGKELRNRLAKAAMSERLGGDKHVPGPELAELYREWSSSGAGLLITGNVMVDRGAIAEPGNVVLDEESPLAPFETWAAQTNETETWMQMNHPGRQALRLSTDQTVAPSSVRLKGMFGLFATPRRLEPVEIKGIIQAFGRTASLAKQAGFDGVQIHGAHGYLISQFLSPLTNQREDAWGGSPAKRRRFAIEVVREVRSRVGGDFPVGMKLNSADFQRGGFTEEESMKLVEVLEDEGIDLLEISGGTYEKAEMFEETEIAESTRRREAFFIDYAETVRDRTSLPLMVTGGFRTADAMRDAVQSGAVDVVGLARPMAIEPDIPRRVLNHETEGVDRPDLSTGFKKLDSFLQGAWYQAQIKRMGAGKRPAPNLSRIGATLQYICS
jgi:2,4-dienoyl-CoA reductase-like NADH-dependent reductase (Old Yellow Enzyme family)